ncbi:MAG: tetratricopeptide repeat protein [Sphingomonas taxi]
MGKIVATLLAGACLTTPALAADRTGYQAIAAGDFATAVTRIEAERRIFPRRPELMLNLAVAYARTGRAGEARALYQHVLARPEVAMDMPDGTILSSHDVATRGLARLPLRTLATR